MKNKVAYDEGKQYHSPEPNFKGSNNTVLIAIITALSILLVVVIVLIISSMTDGDANDKKESITEAEEKVIAQESDEPNSSSKPNNDPVIAVEESTEKDKVVRYYVRKAYVNEESQVGAFQDLLNAISYADQYARSGYKVYDTNGSMVYDPAEKSSTINGARYRVRISATDADSQIGAFEELKNAIALAEQYQSKGYQVFDMDGKLIYTP